MKDTHVHISIEAHALAIKGAKAQKISLKEFVSRAIKAAAKKSK